MYKNLYAIIVLCVSLATISMSHAKKENINNWTSNVSWACNRSFKALAQTITENPVCSVIASYHLLFDREAIRDNTFWSGVFGACVTASFVKNLFAPKSHPKNFLVRTAVENPFFTFVAGHMLLLHRDKINQYPLETMVVGGTLLFELAANYQKKGLNDDGLEAV